MTQQPFSRPGAIDLSALKRPAAPPAGAAGRGGDAGRRVVLARGRRAELPGHPRGVDDGAGPAGVLLAEPARRERADGPRPGDRRRGVRGPLPRRARRHRRLARDRAGRAAPVGALRLRGPRRPPGPADPGRHEARRPARRHQPGHAAADRAGHDRPAPAARGRRRARPRTRAASRRSTRATPPAQDALAADDYDGAVAEYQKLVDANPADAEAAAGLAMAKLLLRTKDVDLDEAARRRPPRRPTTSRPRPWSPTSTCSAARSRTRSPGSSSWSAGTAGDERNAAREHLVGLFAAVGNDDPRVLKGRQALANALF